jgi:hypothetical protein
VGRINKLNSRYNVLCIIFRLRITNSLNTTGAKITHGSLKIEF